MTRDEAIEILRCRKDGDAAEALEVVLKAAEAQPCEDAVSREEVYKSISRQQEHIKLIRKGKVPKGEQAIFKDMIAYINELPSVQPKSELKNIRAEIMSIGNWRRKSEIPNGYLVQAIEILDKHIGG